MCRPTSVRSIGFLFFILGTEELHPAPRFLILCRVRRGEGYGVVPLYQWPWALSTVFLTRQLYCLNHWFDKGKYSCSTYRALARSRPLLFRPVSLFSPRYRNLMTDGAKVREVVEIVRGYVPQPQASWREDTAEYLSLPKKTAVISVTKTCYAPFGEVAMSYLPSDRQWSSAFSHALQRLHGPTPNSGWLRPFRA